MRIRILKTVSDEVDGIDVSSLRPGMIYELPATLASYLILNAAGEPVELRAIDPIEERIAVNVETWREIAANSTPGRHRDGALTSKPKRK